MRWLLVGLLFAACARRLPEPELQARCDAGRTQDCLDLGLARLDRGDVDGAVPLLSRACANRRGAACGELNALHGTAWASLPAMERSLSAARLACARGGTVSCQLARELESRSAALHDQESAADAALAEKVAQKNAGLACGPDDGGLEKEDLQAVIDRHAPDVRAC